MKIKVSKGYRAFTALNTLLMILLVLITAYPIYYCLVASFSDPAALERNAGKVLLAPFTPLTVGAYGKVLHHRLFLSGCRNTLIVLAAGTALNMLLTVAAGYGLSRKGLMLNRVFSFIIIFTMYFSGGLVPGYLNIRDLGLLDTLWALILPGAVSAYNLIIMRTSFAAIPESLIESAQLDGARHPVILWKIAIPLAMPTIAVLVLYYAVGHWNAWFGASIYLLNSDLFPLQLVMRNILNSASVSMLGDVDASDQARYVELIKYALIVVSTVPILVLYPFLQKYFVKGMMIGAVKG